MLQQTQVERVAPFYRAFLRAFPTFRSLAKTSTARVLKVWQGLGYNRRALMLQRCAQEVVDNYHGTLPRGYEELQKLPGIGPYTAGAVMAFAFNEPVAIIETNIRRVYLHHFFPDKRSVPDARILPIVERTLDRKNPRRWYSALMDYGTYLAQQMPNPNRRSKHYVRQAAFEGSERQLRGRVLREVLARRQVTMLQLGATVGDSRLPVVVAGLEREGFLVRRGQHIRCA